MSDPREHLSVTRPLVATCLVVTAAVLPVFLVGALAVQIRQELSTVLCRCFANVRMLRAIKRYARGIAK